MTQPSYDDLYNLLASQRAIRKFKPEDVDDETVRKILRAATRAPSGGNRQPWRYLVIRDKNTKTRLGQIFDELGQVRSGGAPDRTPWSDVPVLIAFCSEAGESNDIGSITALAASIYPGVQNLLLAAHALGLGTVLTTRWKRREDEVRKLLGLPESMMVHAIIPVGWPDGTYGRGRRLPVREVAFRERFGGEAF